MVAPKGRSERNPARKQQKGCSLRMPEGFIYYKRQNYQQQPLFLYKVSTKNEPLPYKRLLLTHIAIIRHTYFRVNDATLRFGDLTINMILLTRTANERNATKCR